MPLDPGAVVVVSPHLDDAVLGCGQLLARSPGSIVITVFAGSPPPGTPLTEWDAAAGFGRLDDPMRQRRAEDAAALDHLGARPVWLDFLDAQYGLSPTVEELVEPLQQAVLAVSPRRVFMPFGLFHSDHHLVHRACLAVALCHPELDWLAYEEPSYRHIPGLVEERLTALRHADVGLVRDDPRLGDVGMAQKRAAVAEYQSQLRALTTPARPGYASAFDPERYWRMDLPGGAEGAAGGRAAEGVA